MTGHPIPDGHRPVDAGGTHAEAVCLEPPNGIHRAGAAEPVRPSAGADPIGGRGVP